MPGVEHGPVDQRFGSGGHVGVFHHIAGILAAKLQPHPGEGAAGGAFDGLSGPDGAGEIDKAKGARGDQLCGGLVIEKDVLEHVRGHACFVEGAGHTLARQ